MNAPVATKQPVIPVLKRRIRALTVLAGATAIAVVLASISQWQRGATSDPVFQQVRMFPSLEAKVDDVASIQIETKSSVFSVTRRADGQWILPDKAGYGADFNTVRKTILGLAELDLIEPRTARADWQEKLGLGLPKSSGSGSLVTLKDKNGEVVATLLSGAAVEGASAGGKQAIYVRRPSDAQTYVARGSYSLDTSQEQWLDKSFIDFARDRIKTVAVKPFAGAAYTVTRDKPESQNFSVIERLPSGRSLRSEGEPNGVGNALMGMSFTDVVPQSKVDFSKPARSTFQTFDGLALNLIIALKDNEYWVALDAIADNSVKPPPNPTASKLKPDIAKEAKEINAMAKGWAYKIPNFKGALLTSSVEALLTPIDAGASR